MLHHQIRRQSLSAKLSGRRVLHVHYRAGGEHYGASDQFRADPRHDQQNVLGEAVMQHLYLSEGMHRGHSVTVGQVLLEHPPESRDLGPVLFRLHACRQSPLTRPDASLRYPAAVGEIDRRRQVAAVPACTEAKQRV